MSRKFSAQLLTGASLADSTGIGVLDENYCAQAEEFGFAVEFDGTAAAGTVLIEHASNKDYAGTWAVLATVNFSAASKSHYVGLTGAYAAIRARVSSAVTSGTVSVRATGNG